MLNFNYKLEEMSEEMGKSIEQAKAVIEQQDTLVKIVEAHKDHERFADFIKEASENTQQTKTQIAILEFRLQVLNACVKQCQENEAIGNAVSNLLLALGVVDMSEVMENADFVATPSTDAK